MKKQPNLLGRAAWISAFVAAAWTACGAVRAHMATSDAAFVLSYMGAGFLIHLIEAFIPVGLLVLAWAAISRLTQKRGE